MEVVVSHELLLPLILVLRLPPIVLLPPLRIVVPPERPRRPSPHPWGDTLLHHGGLWILRFFRLLEPARSH